MRAGVISLAAALALAGCTGAGNRPPPKPEQLNVRVAAGEDAFARVQVLTRTGELRFVAADGSTRSLPVSSAAGQRLLGEGARAAAAPRQTARVAAQEATEAAPRSLAANGPVLSEARRAEFESHALPALPALDRGEKSKPEDFRGAVVAPVKGDKAGTLVEVQAKLRQGVDDDLAFAYATCAVAGWVAEHGGGYARHIRSVNRNSNATLTKSSVFTISKTRPVGLMVVDVKETLRECKTRGIPAA